MLQNKGVNWLVYCEGVGVLHVCGTVRFASQTILAQSVSNASQVRLPAIFQWSDWLKNVTFPAALDVAQLRDQESSESMSTVVIRLLWLGHVTDVHIVCRLHT